MRFFVLSEQLRELCKMFRHVPVRPTTVPLYKLLRVTAEGSHICVEYQTDKFHISFPLVGTCEEPGSVFIPIQCLSAIASFSTSDETLEVALEADHLVFRNKHRHSIGFSAIKADGVFWQVCEEERLLVLDKRATQFIAKYAKSSFADERNTNIGEQYPRVLLNALTNEIICMKDCYHMVDYVHRCPCEKTEPFAWEISPWTSRMLMAMSGLGMVVNVAVGKTQTGMEVLIYRNGRCTICLPTLDIRRFWSNDAEKTVPGETSIQVNKKDLLSLLHLFTLDKKYVSLEVNAKDKLLEFVYGTKYSEQVNTIEAEMKNGLSCRFRCNIYYLEEILRMAKDNIIYLTLHDGILAFTTSDKLVFGLLACLRQKREPHES